MNNNILTTELGLRSFKTMVHREILDERFKNDNFSGVNT